MGATINEAAGIVTFPKGLKHFDSNYLYEFMYSGGSQISKGKLVQFPSYEGIGSGVQRINTLIEALTPFTSHEKQICNAISSKMRSTRPLINPKLMMLYRMNKCEKSQSI